MFFELVCMHAVKVGTRVLCGGSVNVSQVILHCSILTWCVSLPRGQFIDIFLIHQENQSTQPSRVFLFAAMVNIEYLLSSFCFRWHNDDKCGH